MIDLFSRLDNFMSYRGLNDNKISNEAGIANGIIGKARKRGALSQDNIAKILYRYAELDANWLFTGRGRMLRDVDFDVVEGESEKKKETGARVYKLRTDKVVEEQAIPLYNLEVSAGVVTLFRDAKETKPVDFINIPNLPKCDGAIYVTGDSMYPLLKSGDIVMYKQMHDIKNGLIWGEMYIVSVDYDGDEIVSVKWLQKSDKGEDWIKLVSENRHHPDREIELSRVRALAIVKASIRINSMS